MGGNDASAAMVGEEGELGTLDRVREECLEDSVGGVPFDVFGVVQAMASEWKGFEDSGPGVVLLVSLQDQLMTDGLVEFLLRSTDERSSFLVQCSPQLIVLSTVGVENGTFDVGVELGSGAGPVSGHSTDAASDSLGAQVEERVLGGVLSQRHERLALAAFANR